MLLKPEFQHSLLQQVSERKLLKEKKHIRSIVVEGPEVNYETDLRGSNIGKLLENVSGAAEIASARQITTARSEWENG